MFDSNTDRLIDEIRMVVDIGEINGILKVVFPPAPLEMDDEAMHMFYERVDLPLPAYHHSIWECAMKRIEDLQRSAVRLNKVIVFGMQAMKFK